VARREVFGFVGGDGSQVDLSRVTTVAWAAPDNYALLCRAHASGTRVILSAPRPELVLTRNASARAEWVALTVAAVLSSHHDGVVFDWEAPCPVGSPLQAWYALLISETRDALHRVHDGYQVSTCVAWSPDDIDGRGYDIRTFALASDLLYVMDYDTRSQASRVGWRWGQPGPQAVSCFQARGTGGTLVLPSRARPNAAWLALLL
jgi:di-N-acetylchitobiase